MKIYSKNGWILPDGKYIECVPYGHIKCAKEKLGIEADKLEKIAVKVSCTPPSCIMEYSPEFFTERREMTEQQLKTIEEYCITFVCRPPSDYFMQQDLYDMADMSTDTILSILEKK